MAKNTTQRAHTGNALAMQQPDLAALLSAVLNHPDLPGDLEEAFGEAMNDLFNRLPKGVWRKIEYSPAYITLLLAVNQEKGERDEA